jgi:selenocysteine-specific elongation factor
MASDAPHLGHLVLGTAGHIDHGKTSLVRALTGIDTDRLKEEKERGITIELGFAHIDLEGRRLGIVDVPGHERFVRAMVAGATGIDLVMLVVAADEGIMPQTREHLDICGLLGVRRGVVVVTKADLYAGDDGQAWLTVVEEELRRALHGTFLADASIVRFSAHTGQGKDELLATLGAVVGQIPERDAGGVPRLPVDRVFTLRGFGTVVTGTMIGGHLKVGDPVVLWPSGKTARLRGLQVHGGPVESAQAGMRVAANLQGLEREEVERGELLTVPGTLAPSSLIDVELRYLQSGARPLGRRTKVLVHHGTRQVSATMVLLDRAPVEPGERAMAQLRLEEPLVALPGDRYIVRGFRVLEHYGTTLGGGEVLRAHPGKHRLNRPAELSRAADQLARILAGDEEARVEVEIEAQGYSGLDRGGLRQRFAMADQQLAFLVARLAARGKLVMYDKPGLGVVESGAFQRLCLHLLKELDAFHAREKSRPGMPLAELRATLPVEVPAKLASHLLEHLVAHKDLVIEGEVGRRPQHRAAGADPRLAKLKERIAGTYGRAAFTPPRTQDLGAELGESDARLLKDALAQLEKEGVLVRVNAELSFSATAVADLRERLVAYLRQHGEITAQTFKDMVGATRKYVIPLAEHFDAVKLTMRVGEVRRLRGAQAGA